MNRGDVKIFDLKIHFPDGGRFTSGEIKALIARELTVDPEMGDVFAAISILNQQPGDVQISGDRYVYRPLPVPPVNTAGLNS